MCSEERKSEKENHSYKNEQTSNKRKNEKLNKKMSDDLVNENKKKERKLKSLPFENIFCHVLLVSQEYVY